MKENKKTIIIVLVVIVLVALILGVGYYLTQKTTKTDALKFKEAYEALNGEKSTSGKEYTKLEISETNPIVYKTAEEIIADADAGKSFVVLFGFATCPWCRTALPSLLEAATETGINEIYYLDVKDIRDQKIFNADGTITTEKEGSEGYKKLLSKFGDVLSPYEGLNDESVKRIYSPTVLFVHNGKGDSIHVSTVESHEDPYLPLTEEQNQELVELLSKKIQDVLACPPVAC